MVDPPAGPQPSRRPGPRRPRGSPVGPEQVRRAVLDAAGELFGIHGVAAVSLRDIAARAHVNVSLIRRYVGSREELIETVFGDLTESLAQEVLDRPLQQISFERDSVMGRWTIMINHFAVTGDSLVPAKATFNPMLALAEVITENYGLDERAARLRGAQIVASALGWRIFEEYLVSAGGLTDIDVSLLRDELTATHRRVGATPWTPPPDPQGEETSGT